MTTSELVFVGIKGSVVALRCDNGEQVWATHLKGRDFVNVLVQDGIIIASTYGEVFCLEALTGTARWHNALKGFGLGLATLATCQNSTTSNLPVSAEKRRQDAQNAAAAAAV